MITVDTNIVVRLLTRDDEIQFQQSYQLFQTQQIFIADTVILETEWVLRFAYQFKPEDVCRGLRMIFGLPNVHLANTNLIAQVLAWHEDGLDFADALHLAKSEDFEAIYTFDDKFFKKAQGRSRCAIRKPDQD